MRESAIIKAEFAKIEELVNALPESFANIKTTVLEFITQLEGYMANIEEELQAYFTEGGAYKVAMQNFITEKQILLEARLAGTATKLQESVVSAKESALKLAKSAINDAVALVKTTMNTVLTQIETTLGTLLQSSQSTINTAIENAKTNFQANFTVKFETLIENNNDTWATPAA